MKILIIPICIFNILLLSGCTDSVNDKYDNALIEAQITNKPLLDYLNHIDMKEIKFKINQANSFIDDFIVTKDINMFNNYLSFEPWQRAYINNVINKYNKYNPLFTKLYDLFESNNNEYGKYVNYLSSNNSFDLFIWFYLCRDSKYKDVEIGFPNDVGYHDLKYRISFTNEIQRNDILYKYIDLIIQSNMNEFALNIVLDKMIMTPNIEYSNNEYNSLLKVIKIINDKNDYKLINKTINTIIDYKYFINLINEQEIKRLFRIYYYFNIHNINVILHEKSIDFNDNYKNNNYEFALLLPWLYLYKNNSLSVDELKNIESFYGEIYGTNYYNSYKNIIDKYLSEYKEIRQIK